MKILRLFYLSVLLVMSLPTQAQENPKLDSLLAVLKTQAKDTLKVLTLEKLFWEELYTHPLEAKKYAQMAEKVSRDISYLKGQGYANYHLGGGYYQVVGKNDSTRYHLKKALSIFKELKNERLIAAMTSALGVAEYTDGNYDKAIELFNVELEYAQKNGDMRTVASQTGYKAMAYIKKGSHLLGLENSIESLKLYDSLASVTATKSLKRQVATAAIRVGYSENGLKNYENALKYFERAIKLYEEIDDIVFMGHTYSDIGSVYIDTHQPEKAIEYYQKTLTISKKEEIPSMQGYVLINMGKAYKLLEEYDKALPHLNEGLKINTEYGTKDDISLNLNQLGDTYLKYGEPEMAITYLDQAIQLSDSIGATDVLTDAYSIRSETYKELGRFKMAFEDRKKYQSLKDSTYTTTKSQQIEELRTIYETEKKEQQIALQEKEITVLEQKAEIGVLQKALLGGLLVLSLIGFYGVKQKLRRNKLEKEKVDAELAFKRKELTTHALHLAKKNEVLEGLKQKAQELKEKEASNNGYHQLIRTINFDLQDDNNWKNFSRYFEELHKDFNSNVKSRYPQVTSNELRLLALLKMNLSSKEIANILNISPEGIKKARYRLRKKLDITTESSLQDLVLNL